MGDKRELTAAIKEFERRATEEDRSLVDLGAESREGLEARGAAQANRDAASYLRSALNEGEGEQVGEATASRVKPLAKPQPEGGRTLGEARVHARYLRECCEIAEAERDEAECRPLPEELVLVIRERDSRLTHQQIQELLGGREAVEVVAIGLFVRDPGREQHIWQDGGHGGILISDEERDHYRSGARSILRSLTQLLGERT